MKQIAIKWKENEIWKKKKQLVLIMKYFRLKDVERENKELKETLINLIKLFVNRNDALEKTIKDIDKNLRLIARKRW